MVGFRLAELEFARRQYEPSSEAHDPTCIGLYIEPIRPRVLPHDGIQSLRAGADSADKDAGTFEAGDSQQS